MMIDGLKVLMSSEELAQRLAERILWHQQTAKEYEEELRNPGTDAEREATPEHVLEHEMREHQEQAATLTLLRDHLVPNEIYRLNEMDLRFADLVPEFHMEYSMPRRRGAEGKGPGAGSGALWES
jgi:hypothetical protein